MDLIYGKMQTRLIPAKAMNEKLKDLKVSLNFLLTKIFNLNLEILHVSSNSAKSSIDRPRSNAACFSRSYTSGFKRNMVLRSDMCASMIKSLTCNSNSLCNSLVYSLRYS